MKSIDSTGAPLVHVPGWMDGRMDGWMGVKAVLRIAYSNQKVNRVRFGWKCVWGGLVIVTKSNNYYSPVILGGGG
jgi:hypothetical protein